jgi:hypothetical protein
MQAAAPPGRLAGASGDLRFQVEVRRHGRHLAVNRGQIRVLAAAQQHAEHQVAADDHLLDVEHAQLVRGEDGEQP